MPKPIFLLTAGHGNLGQALGSLRQESLLSPFTILSRDQAGEQMAASFCRGFFFGGCKITLKHSAPMEAFPIRGTSCDQRPAAGEQSRSRRTLTWVQWPSPQCE